MTDRPNAFRDFLKSEIGRRQMSATEFARFVGVNTTTITRAIDEHSPKSPGLDFLLKLSKATHTSIATLIELAFPDVAEETASTPSSRILAQRIEQLPEGVRETIEAIIRGTSQ